MDTLPECLRGPKGQWECCKQEGGASTVCLYWWGDVLQLPLLMLPARLWGAEEALSDEDKEQMKS